MQFLQETPHSPGDITLVAGTLRILPFSVHICEFQLPGFTPTFHCATALFISVTLDENSASPLRDE